MNRTSSSTVRINALIAEALELLEQFKKSQSAAERSAIHEKVKTLLNTTIPRHPKYAGFVNDNTVFYESFLQMRELMKHNESVVLESRFQDLRRNSHSGGLRPAFNGAHSNGTASINEHPVNGSAVAQSPPKAIPDRFASLDPLHTALPYPTSPRAGERRQSSAALTMPEPHRKPEPLKKPEPLRKAATMPIQGKFDISPSILYHKIQKSKVLVIDLRPQERYESAHIKCDLITHFDPASIRPDMTDFELQDSLVISDPQEFDSFGRRHEVDLLCVYDASSQTSDHGSLNILFSVLRAAGLHPYLLRGGFDAWVRQYPAEVTAPQGASAHPRELTPPLPVAPPPPVPPHIQPRRKPVPPPKEPQLSPPNSRPQLSPPNYSPPRAQLPVKSHTVDAASLEMPKYTPPSVPVPVPLQTRQNSFSRATRPKVPVPDAHSGYMDAPAKTTLPSLRVPKFMPSATMQSAPSLPAPNRDDTQAPARLPSPPRQPTPPYVEEQVPPYLLSSTGLKNMGNTCYMNCVIQCLAGLPKLVESFNDGSFMQYINYQSRLGHKGRFTCVFADLVRAIFETGAIRTFQGDNIMLAPFQLKNVAAELRPDDFAGFEQQDCQEFLTFVLDELHEDLNSNGDKPKPGPLSDAQEKMREQMGIRAASAIEWERYLEGDTSLIVDMFQGQYLSRLQCLTCRHTSTTYNAFSTLSLPIVSHKLLSQHSSLKACFEEFVKPEVLTGDNAWFCPHCQTKRRTVKTLQISRLPPVLVIHLKRFKRTSSGVNKLETPVDYPLRGLDLTRYWPQSRQSELSAHEAEILDKIPSRGQEAPFIYDLRAVTMHTGTLKGGHYTAVVQKPGRGWLYYDDANVFPVKEQAAVSKNAYVLFYRRRM